MVSVMTLKAHELAQGLPTDFLNVLPTHCSFCKLPLDISPTLTRITCTNTYCSSLKFGKMKYLLSELGVEVSDEQLKELAKREDKNLFDMILSIEGLLDLLQEMSLKDLILLFIGQNFSTQIEQIFEKYAITSTEDFFKVFQSLESLQETMDEFMEDSIDDRGREIFDIVISELYEKVLGNKVFIEKVSKK